MKIFSAICALLFFTSGSFAACTAPAASVGTNRYFPAGGEYQTCSSSSVWNSLGPTNEVPIGVCTQAGQIVQDMYCNGAKWRSISSGTVSGGTCLAAESYMLKYFSDFMHICISGDWYKTGDTFQVGGVCSDLLTEFECSTDPGCEWNGLACVDIPTGGGGGGGEI